ncbi:SusE outer membrane protein [Salegentibacter holothuriorum]|uniref:SusE outer membrane protein n=1 Tax=Salegentibacter holothuriorum TaxID=241145 RepID=A0A1T5AUI9_9FLAO|nr:SusE domain-containing protein [Salegentibacter holothuriorum]SKB38616.1 SusE outer membrane protein [Salegentibacter holothuriorum]
MKKFSILFLAFVALLSFNACTQDDDIVFVAQPDPEGIQFSNSLQSTYVLQSANPDNLAERFVWNEVDFQAPTTISYELQGSVSEAFDSYMVIGSTGSNNLGVTIGQMLDLAEEAGLDNDPETEMPNTGTVYFKVSAFAGEGEGNALEEFSEIVNVNIELPEGEEEEIEIPKLYMVGSFQAAGGYGSDWTPADGAPLAASAAGKTDFEGFVFVNVDTPEFKFLPSNEKWDGDYGDAGDTNGVYTGVLLQEEESNAGTPDGKGGYYFVEADTEKMTYDLTETNWGIIGNATPTGWDSDTDMVYDPVTKVWSITLDLTAQEAPDNGIKFRANDAWDFNIGDTDADGTMEFGGDNIGIPENGNYTITLDLSNPRNYTYSITKN